MVSLFMVEKGLEKMGIALNTINNNRKSNRENLEGGKEGGGGGRGGE